MRNCWSSWCFRPRTRGRPHADRPPTKGRPHADQRVDHSRSDVAPVPVPTVHRPRWARRLDHGTLHRRAPARRPQIGERQLVQMRVDDADGSQQPLRVVMQSQDLLAVLASEQALDRVCRTLVRVDLPGLLRALVDGEHEAPRERLVVEDTRTRSGLTIAAIDVRSDPDRQRTRVPVRRASSVVGFRRQRTTPVRFPAPRLDPPIWGGYRPISVGRRHVDLLNPSTASQSNQDTHTFLDVSQLHVIPPEAS